jgi:hypothetical protein
MSPFAALPLARQRSSTCYPQQSVGGEVVIVPFARLKSDQNRHACVVDGFGVLFFSMSELVQMNQNPLPYPLQMRNGGLPPAYLPSSAATPLDPLRWLAPPQRATEPQPPVRASDAATSALAHYDEIISQWMISLYHQALAKCTKLAVHAQRVETMQSIMLDA